MDATAALDGEVPDASDPTDAAQLDAEPSDAEPPDPDPDAAIDAGPDATACSDPAPVLGVIGTRAAPHEVSAAEPVLIDGMLLDWSGRAFVRVTGVTPGESYVLKASAPRALLELAVFDDDATFVRARCLSSMEEHGEAACRFVASGTSVYASVDALHESTPIDLELRPTLDAQGTAAAPELLVYEAGSALPVIATYEPGSYYEVTGLTSGQAYAVSAAGLTERAHLDVAGSPSEIPDHAFGNEPHAIGVPSATSLFVRLQSTASDTTAELRIAPVQLGGEGTDAQPVELDYDEPWRKAGSIGAAYSDPSGERSQSFYVLNNVPNGWHVVQVRSDVRLRVASFGDTAVFSGAVDCLAEGRGTLQCATETRTGSLYVSIANTGGPGGAFELTLVPAANVSEGTKARPIAVPLSAGQIEGHVAPYGVSYYAFTGLRAGQLYRIESAAGMPVSGRVFSDSGFSSGLCVFDNSLERACAVEATGSTLYVWVQPESGPSEADIGAVFDLSIRPLTTRGDEVIEVDLECALGGAYQGEVAASGVSLVELGGLDARFEYLVEVVSGDQLSIEVFSGAGEPPFSGDSCEVFGSGVTLKRCVQRPVEDALHLRVASTPAGSTFEAIVRAIDVSTLGSAEEPFELEVAALPYEGHVPGAAGAYFALTGLEPNTAYSIGLTAFDEQLLASLVDADGIERADTQRVVPGEPAVASFTTRADETIVYLHVLSDAPSGSDFKLELTTGGDTEDDAGMP